MSRFASAVILFKQPVAPDNTSDYGPTLGDLWVDTSLSPPVTKKLTSMYPFVWASIEGGGSGTPSVVATLNLTAQSANIPSTTLYAVPLGGDGMYRVSCQTVITRVATGGTVNLPQVNLNWTDFDTGVSEPTTPWTAIALTPQGSTANVLGYTSLNDTQTSIGMSPPLIGTFPPPPFFAKGGTNLTVSSTGYSGGTGTVMQYAAHFKVEYLGS